MEMSDSSYDYTDSDSDDMEYHILLDPGDQKVTANNPETEVDGMGENKVWVQDENKKSAFDIDINRLKTKKWTMTGDESDYFNYGMNESIWKVIQCSSLFTCRIMQRLLIEDGEESILTIYCH